MYLQDGKLVFSPSDLSLYTESPFASWMEHLAKVYPDKAPQKDNDDSLMELLQSKGLEHESEVLKGLNKEGMSILDASEFENPFEATIAAMKDGYDVVFQGALEKAPFRGYSDFLVKVPGKSRWGDYHYEVWDTKLSKSVKPYFIVQLCCYQEMLAQTQGKYSEEFVVVLGDGTHERLRTSDYFYYYRSLKNAFLRMHSNFRVDNQSDPADSASWGNWNTCAQQILKEADHLSQVANITRSQIKKLARSEVFTVEDLIHSSLENLPGINQEVFKRLKSQAAIQKKSEGLNKPLYKVINNTEGRKIGLSTLPPHSNLDVFFDIEGFPMEEGGLEYLWGAAYFDENGDRQFVDYWAHNHEQEKQAFESFISWVYTRWKEDPAMHIYHYANYEIAACRKLMSRYGVCEYEVDQLLRNEVFVDLYKVVKCGLIIGEPKYSIKNVEHLYREGRDTEVASGGESVVVYEQWRQDPDGSCWRSSRVLNDIREYNIDDCHSTQELVEWLRERQGEAGLSYLGREEVLEPDVQEEVTARSLLRDELLEHAERMEVIESNEAALIRNLAWSLEFHRRENKPVFWRLFDRLGLDELELHEDLDCLANCVRTKRAPYKLSSRKRKLAYEFKFDITQECKLSARDYYVLGEEYDDGNRVKVELLRNESDLAEGLIVVESSEDLPAVISLIPDEYVPPGPIPGSIECVVRKCVEDIHQSLAILDFLRRDYPRIKGRKVGETVVCSHSSEDKLTQIISAVMNLDGSYMAIQGPPGAGKTYTGKNIIVELLKQGKRIAISSNSHKAINNLLIGAAELCAKQSISASFVCTRDTDEALEKLGVVVLKNADLAGQLSEACVIGTTAWGLSRDDLEGAFDYLFIDEAGQVSLANLIAMSRSATNLILMGDQMQLGQPAQGVHPGDSGKSILDYLLEGKPTIPAEMGAFLGTTYRMHSAVNTFISEAIYEGKLDVAEGNDNQKVLVPPNYTGPLNKDAGIVHLAVEHEGNTQGSDEEADAILVSAKQLLGRTYIDKSGQEREISWDDMLFVAPYNYQVNKLQILLGDQARVGSVDKFQGQEAPIVFLSMCASDGGESPRGLDFLLDKNRINVAISRAQCLAIVVANPGLVGTKANSVKSQAKINLFCHLLEYGS